MDKDQILSEIRRTAAENKGIALGVRRFSEKTGIRYYDWYGKFWTRWGDAVREAGVEPRRMSEAYSEEFLLQKLVGLTRRLSRVPTRGDILFETKHDPTFPSEKVFRRLGSKPRCAQRVVTFCSTRPDQNDVSLLWRAVREFPEAAEFEKTSISSSDGYVYLIRHGSRREYKIGRTANPIRREGEVGLELPETIRPIHYIQTDDPSGVEAYWHKRFAGKRKKGEWFALSSDDVRAFKRWKRIS